MAGMRPIAYVIDGNETVRKAFSRLLRSEHIEVRAFSSAEEFLKSDIRTRGRA
jgi:FixJ family two-component response regulator